MNIMHASTLLTILAATSIRSAVLIALVAFASLAMRRSPASSRHAAWASCVLIVLVLPFLWLTLKLRLNVPELPHLQRVSVVALRYDVAPLLQTESGPTAQAIPNANRTAQDAISPPITAYPAPDMPVPARPSPALTIPKSAGARPSWQSILALLWLCGSAIAIIRLCRAHVAIHRSIARSTRLDTSLALESNFETADLRTADVPVPLTYGLRRPVILLPKEALEWPSDRVRSAVLHELAHVSRRDWAMQIAASIMCALYWFHPLAHLCANRMRMESESASDDLVLADGRIAAPDYAAHLIDVARSARRYSGASAVAAMAQSGRIESRVRAILAGNQPRTTLSAPRLAAIVTALTLVGLAVSSVRIVPIALAAPSDVSIAAPAGSYEAVVPDVGRFSVVGITEPFASSTWWGPDGKPLSAPAMSWPSETPIKSGPAVRDVGMALQIRDLGRLQPLMISLGNSVGGAARWVRTGQSKDGTASYAVDAPLPASSNFCTLRVSEMTGSWRTAAVWRSGGANKDQSHVWIATQHDARIRPALQLSFSSGRIALNGAVHLTMNEISGREDERVVAVGSDGRNITLNWLGWKPTGPNFPSMDWVHWKPSTRNWTSKDMYSYSSLSAIGEIRLEERPYRYKTIATIPNIALHPGQTNVTAAANVEDFQNAVRRYNASIEKLWEGAAPSERTAPGGVAQFANDVTVDVAGVTDLGNEAANSSPASWWSSAATPSSRPFSWPVTQHERALQPTDGQRKVGFAVMVNSPERTYAALRWQVVVPGSSKPVPTVGQWVQETPYAQSLRMRYAISAIVPSKARTCTLRVDVPDWKMHDVDIWTAGGANTPTAGQWTADTPGAPNLIIKSTPQGVYVSTASMPPVDLGWKWVAVGRNGVIAPTSLQATVETPKDHRAEVQANVIASFPVPLSGITSFRLQMQTHNWQDIRNVPLWPADATATALTMAQ
jgi:beta-lactamase regulating signal transducer with metallopeptidase domain